MTDQFSGLFDRVARSRLGAESINTNLEFSELAKGALNEGLLRSSIASSGAFPVGHQDEYVLQQQLRPWFGKSGLNQSGIGTHPDFAHIEADASLQAFQYAVILFVDIKGSTRLNLLYSLQEVTVLKNLVLQMCIEAIRSLDGHVHRLMGDAVMAFFGRAGLPKENAIADAMNCAAVMQLLVQHSVVPWTNSRGYDLTDFGIRVGLDFGDDAEVLWSNFGYSAVGEVTANGLQVDMASKLQGKAGKGGIMLGQSLLQYVDWPDPYSAVKTHTRGGQMEALPYVTPNITHADGTQLNYRMRLLNLSNSTKLLPLPSEFRSAVCGTDVVHCRAISLQCFVGAGSDQAKFQSLSRYLPKDQPLLFRLTLNGDSLAADFPLTVEFQKENHGEEARQKGEDGVHTSSETIYRERHPGHGPNYQPVQVHNHDERTAYRGLHTMRVTVKSHRGQTLFRDWVGVLIV